MSLVIRTKVLAIVLYAAVGWCVAEAAPTIKVDAEGGFIGTLISGSGWVPGEGVKVQLSDSPESNFATLFADGAGKIDGEIFPKDNLIDPGDSIVGVGSDSGTSAAVIVRNTAPPIPEFFVPKELFPSFDMDIPTNLKEVGFVPGFVDLVGTSANVSVVSQTTSYDPSTDLLTTDGVFDFLAFGPAFFTYEAVGLFPLAFDPATGDPLTGTQTSDWTVQVATVVPETGTWAMLVFGFGGIAALIRVRRFLASPLHERSRPEVGVKQVEFDPIEPFAKLS